jgi:hypothetical protein
MTETDWHLVGTAYRGRSCRNVPARSAVYCAGPLGYSARRSGRSRHASVGYYRRLNCVQLEGCSITLAVSHWRELWQRNRLTWGGVRIYYTEYGAAACRMNSAGWLTKRRWQILDAGPEYYRSTTGDSCKANGWQLPDAQAVHTETASHQLGEDVVLSPLTSVASPEAAE